MTAHFRVLVCRPHHRIHRRRGRAVCSRCRSKLRSSVVLIAEAVDNWRPVAMSKVDSRATGCGAGDRDQFCAVRPGEVLELAVDRDCDNNMVVYGGSAAVEGRRVIELRHCLGPMLPVEQFDAPEALRERLALLRDQGAAHGRFQGVDLPPLTVTEHVPGESLRARLDVPRQAIFFAITFRASRFFRRPCCWTRRSAWPPSSSKKAAARRSRAPLRRA